MEVCGRTRGDGDVNSQLTLIAKVQIPLVKVLFSSILNGFIDITMSKVSLPPWISV